MQAIILAGGLGTRISEETHSRPKPMVEIGGRPILWHIMKLLAQQGISEFIICLGYRGYVIKEYFSNYFLHTSDVTIDLRSNHMEIDDSDTENWKVSLVDTGLETETAGRLKRIRERLQGEAFLLTYGDGLADIDLASLTRAHAMNGSAVTVTAVQPQGRFGSLSLDEEASSGIVAEFVEKPAGDGGWINGGFFIVNKSVVDSIDSDRQSWETGVLPALAQKGELGFFKHRGFWHAMDTLRDRNSLDQLASNGRGPWMTWL